MKPVTRGFTILEVLVATSVLALMLVAILQVAGQTTMVARLAGSKMGAGQSVRSALDAVERDLRAAVITPRAALLVGTSSMAFLTCGRGPNTVPARFLGVFYRWNSDGQLIRGYAAVDEAATDLLAAAEGASTSPDQPVVAENILQVAFVAILDDGTRRLLNNPAAGSWNAAGAVPYGEWTVPGGWTALVPAMAALPGSGPRVSALLVAMVGTDPKGSALLSNAQRALFAQPAGADPVSEWEAVAESASLPAPVRSSLSIQSKMIPLP